MGFSELFLLCVNLQHPQNSAAAWSSGMSNGGARMDLYNILSSGNKAPRSLPSTWGENLTFVSPGMRTSSRRQHQGQRGEKEAAQFPLPWPELPVLFQGDKERPSCYFAVKTENGCRARSVPPLRGHFLGVFAQQELPHARIK